MAFLPSAIMMVPVGLISDFCVDALPYPYSYGLYSYGLYRASSLTSVSMRCRDHIVMAYIVTACIVVAYVVMAYMFMAYIVMAYIVMAYIVMAEISMASCLTSVSMRCRNHTHHDCTSALHFCAPVHTSFMMDRWHSHHPTHNRPMAVL